MIRSLHETTLMPTKTIFRYGFPMSLASNHFAAYCTAIRVNVFLSIILRQSPNNGFYVDKYGWESNVEKKRRFNAGIWFMNHSIFAIWVRALICRFIRCDLCQNMRWFRIFGKTLIFFYPVMAIYFQRNLSAMNWTSKRIITSNGSDTIPILVYILLFTNNNFNL